MHNPRLGIVCNDSFPRLVRGVFHPHLYTHLKRLINPLEYALAGCLQSARDLAYRFARVIAQQDLRPLHVADGSGARPMAQLIQFFLLVTRQNELWTRRCPWHATSIPRNKTLWLRCTETLY